MDPELSDKISGAITGTAAAGKLSSEEISELVAAVTTVVSGEEAGEPPHPETEGEPSEDGLSDMENSFKKKPHAFGEMMQ